MPRKGIEFEAEGLRVSLAQDNARFSSGFLAFKIADTWAEVSRGDEKLGGLGTVVGGHFRIEMRGRAYSIGLESLWGLAERIDAAYLKTQGRDA
jgi:hypothetical protein